MASYFESEEFKETVREGAFPMEKNKHDLRSLPEPETHTHMNTQTHAAFKAADEDGNGTLDRDEVYDLFQKISGGAFLFVLFISPSCLQPGLCGTLTDLKESGGENFHVTRDEVEEAMRELDSNSDGVLDMDEFTTFMQSFFLSMAMSSSS